MTLVFPFGKKAANVDADLQYTPPERYSVPQRCSEREDTAAVSDNLELRVVDATAIWNGESQLLSVSQTAARSGHGMDRSRVVQVEPNWRHEAIVIARSRRARPDYLETLWHRRY